MRQVTLGSTGIVTPQNAFGALPIQRISSDEAVYLLHKALDGGMTYFDTAHAYSDSEEKIGRAFHDRRDRLFLATKTHAEDPKTFWEELELSLSRMQTDYIDVYQLHLAPRCFRPGDGTGMYEAMLEAKEKGLIRHIGITAHKIDVAEEIAESGLYETLQYPFSYLASDRDIALVERCKKNNVGYICMKGLAGGLLNNSRACMAFMTQFDNVVPIWGIQKESELDEWLSYFEKTPELDDDVRALIDKDRAELMGDFCRSCGYCAPCTVGIEIHDCARMSQLLRRSPSAQWLSPEWQEKMAKIDECVECGLCMTRCPYELKIPELLKKNLEDYRKVLAGEVIV